MPALDLSLCAECRCLAARRRARAVTRHFEAALRRHGLRATQFSILAALAIGGQRRMGGLAELLGLERTTLTRSARLLEEKGWLRAGRSQDGRERPLLLTAAGRRKLEAAYPSWKAAQDAATRLFPEIVPAAQHARRMPAPPPSFPRKREPRVQPRRKPVGERRATALAPRFPGGDG